MKEIIDSETGQKWIELNHDEVRIGFLSQCIEALAEAENCDHVAMLDRMENVNLTEGYILQHYDTIHSQDWDNIIADLQTLLHRREKSA